MNRKPIKDSNRWLDYDRATVYTVGHRDNINNVNLLLTAGGAWVKNHWTRYSGGYDYYTICTPTEAAQWFLLAEIDLPDQLLPIIRDWEI